jgi:hypothetical protein
LAEPLHPAFAILAFQTGRLPDQKQAVTRQKTFPRGRSRTPSGTPPPHRRERFAEQDPVDAGDEPHQGLPPRFERTQAQIDALDTLVALHSDFDELIIGRNQLWKIGRIDAESDGACGAWLSCDEAGLFER